MKKNVENGKSKFKFDLSWFQSFCSPPPPHYPQHQLSFSPSLKLTALQCWERSCFDLVGHEPNICEASWCFWSLWVFEGRGLVWGCVCRQIQGGKWLQMEETEMEENLLSVFSMSDIMLHAEWFSFFFPLFKIHFGDILYSLLFCISFRCTAQRLDNGILYKGFPLILQVPTGHCAELLQYYWLYSLYSLYCAVLYTPATTV